MKRRTVVTFLALLVLFPGAAVGKSLAPSGNSSVSQYLETVPTAAGGTPSSLIGRHHGTSSISVATQNFMSELGPTGAAAAAADVADAPTMARGASALALAAASGGPASSALASALGGSGAGGLGVMLPIILAACALVAGAVAARRRRREP